MQATTTAATAGAGRDRTAGTATHAGAEDLHGFQRDFAVVNEDRTAHAGSTAATRCASPTEETAELDCEIFQRHRRHRGFIADEDRLTTAFASDGAGPERVAANGQVAGDRRRSGARAGQGRIVIARRQHDQVGTGTRRAGANGTVGIRRANGVDEIATVDVVVDLNGGGLRGIQAGQCQGDRQAQARRAERQDVHVDSPETARV
jgi:hypothetical protein